MELYSTPTIKVYIDKLKKDIIFAYGLDAAKNEKEFKNHISSVLRKLKDYSPTLLLDNGGCRDCYKNIYKYILDSKKPASLVMMDSTRKGGSYHYTK